MESGSLGGFHLGFYPPHAHPGRISGLHKKGGRGSGPDREGGGPGRPNARPGLTKVYPTPPRPSRPTTGQMGPRRREPGRLVFPSLEPWMDRWSAGPGRSGAPDEVRRTSSGTRPPSSSTPRGGKGPSGWSRPHSVTCSPRAVHIQSTYVATYSPRTWVHVRGSPCPGTWGNLWRSTPDGGNHVGLCDRHVETCGPKGIRINWGEVPTFHGAASQTSRRGIPGEGFLSPLFGSGVPGRVKSRLGSPPSWGSRGRTSERSGPSVLRCLQSAGRPQGRGPIQSLSATLSYM